MAVAKFVAALLLALIALSMLQTMVMASNGLGGDHYDNTNMFSPWRGGPNLNPCPSQCAARCGYVAQARCAGCSPEYYDQFKQDCNTFCRTCCGKCNCVTPYNSGTDVCPCYSGLKINNQSCP